MQYFASAFLTSANPAMLLPSCAQAHCRALLGGGFPACPSICTHNPVPALRAYPMPGSPIGWAGRCRTCYLGVKVPCLTVWPQPNKKAPHGTHCEEARGDACRELHLASKLDFYRVIGLCMRHTCPSIMALIRRRIRLIFSRSTCFWANTSKTASTSSWIS